jgi:hypothetical protein
VNSLNNLSQPQHITSLASSAILVAVRNPVWTGQITDQKVRNEVAADNNADTSVVDVTKKLLAKCPQHKSLMTFRQTINNGMKTFTFPWMGNIDCLPMFRHDGFMKWFDERNEEHRDLKSDFGKVYPSFVSDLAFGVSNSLGTLFNRAEFPDVDWVLSRFSLTLQKFPVPMNDFRVQVSQDLADDLHKHYERQAEETAKRIVDNQVEQFLKVLESIKHSCGYTEKTNKHGDKTLVRNKLVETTWQKAIDMIDTFRSFNPTQSPELEDMRTLFEQALRGVDINQLRESDSVRAKVGSEVEGILNKFKVKV